MTAVAANSTRISKRFAELRAAGELGIVAYITAGRPPPASTVHYVLSPHRPPPCWLRCRPRYGKTTSLTPHPAPLRSPPFPPPPPFPFLFFSFPPAPPFPPPPPPPPNLSAEWGAGGAPGLAPNPPGGHPSLADCLSFFPGAARPP